MNPVLELVRAPPARFLSPKVETKRPTGEGVLAQHLHPSRILEAPSSLSAAALHANCVWEKFFNWQN